MELLRTHKRRSTLSEVVYVLLNIGLAITVLGLILVTQSPWLAIAAVLISKWRVLAVRPRYWLAHVQTNLVDTIVGVSFATLMYVAMGSLSIQIAYAVLYTIWLLVIKPRSKRIFIEIQAGTALFLGISALVAVSYDSWSSLVVLASWLIGYAATRHILGSYDEAYRSFLSLAWGFVVAEFGWLFYHWTFAYGSHAMGATKLSQEAVIVLMVSFLAYKVYDSVYKNGLVRLGDVLLPLLLSVSVISVLLLIFNTITTTSI